MTDFAQWANNSRPEKQVFFGSISISIAQWANYRGSGQIRVTRDLLPVLSPTIS